MRTTERRRTKLIDRVQQGRIFVLVVMAASCGVIVQACVVAWSHSQLATRFPDEGRAIMDALPGALLTSGAVSLLLTIPVMLALTLSATFRVFGPLYRFRKFMESVASGEETQPCRLRKNDELQDICALLNEVTVAARRENEGTGGSDGELREAA